MILRRRFPLRRRVLHLALAGVLVTIATNCSTTIPHRGRIPFTWMEATPSRKSDDGHPMTPVIRHHDPDRDPSDDELGRIRAGDVIAFTMSHKQAWEHLRRGEIQKVPYELFRYGHLALVVPSRDGSDGLRLLQVAMKQPVSDHDGLDYLDGKSWETYRPPAGSVDVDRLTEFTEQVVINGSDPGKAYDMASVTGWRNSPWQPERRHEIGSRFSCTTLVVAGLHYAGYELNAVERNGRFDLVTPRQVIESRGSVRMDGSPRLPEE